MLEWETLEYQSKERPQDWYWAVGVIVVALAIAAFIFSTVIVTLLILVAGGTLLLFALRDPDMISVKITDRGVSVDQKLYPFRVFETFWIEDTEYPATLILKSEVAYSPIILIPIAEDVDPEILRDFMLDHIEEEEMFIPLSQKILDFLGF